MIMYIPKKQRWSEMNTLQKIGVVLLPIVQLALLAAALVDIRRRPAEEINGKKSVWTAVAFINFIGPLAYFRYGRKAR